MSTELDKILGKHSKLWNYSKAETRDRLLAWSLQERRKAAREAIADIYTKSTTTEWPRTYETWDEQLKRVLEDKLEELESNTEKEK